MAIITQTWLRDRTRLIGARRQRSASRMRGLLQWNTKRNERSGCHGRSFARIMLSCLCVWWYKRATHARKVSESSLLYLKPWKAGGTRKPAHLEGGTWLKRIGLFIFRGILLCSVVFIFYIYWCIRNFWSSSVILYGSISIVPHHHTNNNLSITFQPLNHPGINTGTA